MLTGTRIPKPCAVPLVFVRFLVVCFLYITNANPRKVICCGKKWPKMPLFNLFFLGLGWPWVGEFDDFIIIFILLPTQHNVLNRKHPMCRRLLLYSPFCALGAMCNDQNKREGRCYRPTKDRGMQHAAVRASLLCSLVSPCFVRVDSSTSPYIAVSGLGRSDLGCFPDHLEQPGLIACCGRRRDRHSFSTLFFVPSR